MGRVVWSKVEKEKTSCILGWFMKRQQWAFPLTRTQILNISIVACKCNPTSKAGLFSMLQRSPKMQKMYAKCGEAQALRQTPTDPNRV